MDNSSLPIINLTYEIYKMTVDITGHLEKQWRYGLGVSLEQSVLDLLKELIMAKNAPKPLKSSFLISASSHLEISTLKFRLLLELKLANETKIFQVQAKLAEVGRMLGGWSKSLRNI
jgi:hypothetical protein